MSTYEFFKGWVGNGFIKSYWGEHHGQEWSWGKIRTSPANKPFARFCGRHKRIGATRGVAHKQFDPEPFKVFKKFNARTSIPNDFEMNWATFHFRFGIKRSKYFW